MKNNKFSTQSNFCTKKKKKRKSFSNEHRSFIGIKESSVHFVEMNIFNLDLDIDSEFFDLLHPREINSRLLLRPDSVEAWHNFVLKWAVPFIPACIDGLNESRSAKRCRWLRWPQ